MKRSLLLPVTSLPGLFFGGCLSSLGLSTGCMTLRGAGEMGAGYRSETKVFLYHTVDGDKQGKTAESSPNLTALVADYAAYLRAKEAVSQETTQPQPPAPVSDPTPDQTADPAPDQDQDQDQDPAPAPQENDGTTDPKPE